MLGVQITAHILNWTLLLHAFVAVTFAQHEVTPEYCAKAPGRAFNGLLALSIQTGSCSTQSTSSWERHKGADTVSDSSGCVVR